MWVFIAIMSVIMHVGLFWPKSHFQNKVPEAISWGFWKLMGIVMGILSGVLLLFYLGLQVYVEFFAAHHR
ncbi:hypothetical protein [Pedobacter miscanthi]|uniref:hypothetical protein n=1 Tax=Pedobacter miscanthi TaxID=2259170 RepID=UPI0029312335|nr:hypothetical protein [Pedobacter miscanthi]